MKVTPIIIYSVQVNQCYFVRSAFSKTQKIIQNTGFIYPNTKLFIVNSCLSILLAPVEKKLKLKMALYSKYLPC